MKEVKEKYLKEIYLNILKAIIIVLYFFALNLAYENISAEHIELGIKIFTMIFLFIAIYIFERAYKKDDDNLAIQGIEILILSAYTLTSRHITNKFNFEFKTYSLVSSYIFAIYFILKCIFIYTKGRKEEAENLSDIKKIVKKDEPVKKEATKKSKEDNKKDIPKSSTKTKSEASAKKEDKKTTSKKSTTAKKKTTTKKSGTTADTETEKEKQNAQTKKKTTTKKATTKTNIENKKEEQIEKSEPNKRKTTTKKSTKKEIEEAPKTEKPKRKQVKKEVKEND